MGNERLGRLTHASSRIALFHFDLSSNGYIRPAKSFLLIKKTNARTNICSKARLENTIFMVLRQQIANS